MKKMNKIYSLLALAFAFVLTGCIDETFPESDSATQEQVEALPSAFEATLRGISAKMTEGYLVYGDQVHETDMSYPQFMLAQTEMLGDIFPGDAIPPGGSQDKTAVFIFDGNCQPVDFQLANITDILAAGRFWP